MGSVALAAAAVCLAGSPADAQRAKGAEGADISGVWWARSYSPKIQPVGGGELPFTPAGKAAYEKNMAGLKNGSVVDKSRTLCVLDGIPRVLQTPYPFDIVQTPGQVTFVYEQNRAVRFVDFTRPLPDADTMADNPRYHGYSTGRWDGDTLVIQSVGFTDKTFIDAFGAPHTEDMQVTERIRTISGGQQLEDLVTVADPKYYARPWSARFVYESHPEVSLETYVCGEKHRDLSRVKGVKGF
jgi:hypothetical protein